MFFKSFFRKLFNWQIVRLDKIHHDLNAINGRLYLLDNKVEQSKVDLSNELLQKMIEQNEILSNKLNTLSDDLLRNVQHQHRTSISKIRVVFLVHAPEFWYALKPIYDRMLQNENFQPIILTVPGDLLGKNFVNIANEYFKVNNISSIDLFDDSSCSQVMRLVNPDVIFKQVPWEGQYQNSLKTLNLLSNRICYIPYGIHTNPIDKVLYNDDIHRYGWRLYCVNESHKKKYAEYNTIKDINTVVSGYTKFEYISHELLNNQTLTWPINSSVASKKKLRILWAPHHSLEGWLGFCTFFLNYQQIIKFAENNQNVEIVFRPHTALYEVMISQNKMTQSQVDWFNDKLFSLPNCYLDDGAEYIHLFKESDILVTDGVGFLFEYLLTGKPIIHTDSKVNCGFNDYYKQIEPAWYKAYEFADIEKLVELLRSGDDPLQATRKELVKLLYPLSDKEPSEIICDDICKSILGK